jgi:Zn-finger nucleic acid-binding protein
MNCTNCGAAMELVESRRYFLCGHCGTFNFPEPPDADGVRILGRLPNAPPCPVCKAALVHALLDADHPVHFCATCRGVLLPRETFANVVNKRRAWATGPPAEPVSLDRRALERALVCPICSRRFETYPHYGPGNIVIDSCPKCDVIWLDFGEIRQIVDAPGTDRGSRQLPRTDASYVRTGPGPALNLEDRRRAGDPLSILFDLFLTD